MLRLPSGNLIDISTDRSRHHALRQPGIASTAPIRQLYALVDIIYRHIDSHGLPRRGWTEYDYTFSGYTLDSVRLANDWSEADKTALFQWVQQTTQKRRIETARRRLADNQPQLSTRCYSAPRHLYSLLQQRLQQLPQQHAPAAQWLATINNMKRNGVREEEIHYSGLRTYLAGHASDTRLSKAQILEHLDWHDIRLELSSEQLWGANGGLNFEETARLMPHQAVYRAALKLDASCQCVLRYVDSHYNYRVGVVKTLDNDHHMAMNKYWFALDPYGRALPNPEKDRKYTGLFFDSGIAAKIAADRHARQHQNIQNGASYHTHFDHLTLYGGNDYREWLLCLPNYQRIFFGAHFFDHNILAHIRTTIRTSTAGEQLLFIEEVQSDWHQSGKRHGYDTSYWGKVANAPFKQEWTALAAKLMLIYASQNGFDGIAWPQGEIQELRYGRQLHSIKQHYDREIPAALDQLGKIFHCETTATTINTRDPWLNLQKSQDKWRVADSSGKFKTRAKYNNREEAMAVITRHCKAIELEVPAFFINEDLRKHIAEKGLPLFGMMIH